MNFNTIIKHLSLIDNNPNNWTGIDVTKNIKGGGINIIDNSSVRVSNSMITGAGNGVYANKNFKKGDIVEVAPYLSVPDSSLNNSILSDYVFNMSHDKYALVLGTGSIYNHKDNPTVSTRYSGDCMVYEALTDIDKDDEMYISYGSGWWEKRNLTSE
jgi:hypothetical protein